VSGTALIGLDWGTTSARAYRIDAEGRAIEERSAPLGIQQVRERAFGPALAGLLGDWAALPVPRLACGMIGSRQGWIEVPYCDTPASPDGLAAGIAVVPGEDLGIVPGVRTRDADGMPDVMRGEETQILGAVDVQSPRVYAVLPGTHSKWARVEHGRLTAFMTFMTGEVYAALIEHTILGRLAEVRASQAFDGESFARGARRGLADGALLHDAFGARTLALEGELAPGGVADWLSGLLIGAEIAAARRFAPDLRSATIVGSAQLTQRYAAACAQAGLDPRMAPPHAAARGLWQLARASGRI
jgi:2-dehydro-3-deoxygalactonokinase